MVGEAVILRAPAAELPGGGHPGGALLEGQREARTRIQNDVDGEQLVVLMDEHPIAVATLQDQMGHLGQPDDLVSGTVR